MIRWHFLGRDRWGHGSHFKVRGCCRGLAVPSHSAQDIFLSRNRVQNPDVACSSDSFWGTETQMQVAGRGALGASDVVKTLTIQCEAADCRALLQASLVSLRSCKDS